MLRDVAKQKHRPVDRSKPVQITDTDSIDLYPPKRKASQWGQDLAARLPVFRRPKASPPKADA